jgi:hypothetical protein
MQTPREKELEERCRVLEMDYYELKDRYDQLCVKLKTNANDTRNEGDRFLRTYARDWR